MEEYTVKDLMIPLSDYVTVSENASLLEAVNALERAQENFDHTRYSHRAILVLDSHGKVSGKLSQLDVLKALDPKYLSLNEHKGMTHYGFSRDFIELTLEQCGLWDTPPQQIYQKVNRLKVKDVMYSPSEGEYVKENSSLDSAIHQLIIGSHQSLLVISNNEESITGILRLTDVFSGLFQIIKECDS